MEIVEFINQYNNHPVLFVGTGISKRYLEDSYTWDELLQKVSFDLYNKNEPYLELKYKHALDKNNYDFPTIATHLEREFDNILEKDRHGKFEEINDIFYQYMEQNTPISRFKIYLSKVLTSIVLKEEKKDELNEFKKIRKNISSVITTNYDLLLEDIFDFNPLIGNHILLSNPYGSIYKIHGCVNRPDEIIITSKDYDNFNNKYELIRAQLLSIFIHNPIIFIGYSIDDENIQQLLKTIFTYVEYHSEEAKKIMSNFLLVEYQEDVNETLVSEYDIHMDGAVIKINKMVTDNFSELYKALSDLHLPISAMDIRKVESVVKEIREGGSIQVNIIDDLNNLQNSDKVLAIGSKDSIKYIYQNISEFIDNYFSIIQEENKQLISLIDKFTIPKRQYFPIHGFLKIKSDINDAQQLQKQQIEKLTKMNLGLEKKFHSIITEKTTIADLNNNKNITASAKQPAILYAAYNDYLTLDEIKTYLTSSTNKKNTEYRQLLCIYDLKKYNTES